MKFAWKDSLGETMFRGSRALAVFMASRRSAPDVDALRDEMTAIAGDAQAAKFQEVFATASANLKLISAGNPEACVCFDTL